MKRPVDERRDVLIVDDDGDTREMYCESLRAYGFEASTAQSGEEALRLAAKAMPDVVVTDLRLGGKMDGFELTRRLRAGSGARFVRIIMLTGATLGGERERAEDAGCDRFLSKPCLPETLASAIRGMALPAFSPRVDARDLSQASRARRAGRSSGPAGRGRR